MAQQTAVMQLLSFILVERRQENGSIQFHAHEDFGRFLQMEKEQIMQSYNDGKSAVIHIEENKSLEQYYNETYNK